MEKEIYQARQAETTAAAKAPAESQHAAKLKPNEIFLLSATSKKHVSAKQRLTLPRKKAKDGTRKRIEERATTATSQQDNYSNE